MILAQLSHYLHQSRRASLQDMAAALNASPDAVEAMLQVLVRKGRVVALPQGSSCGKSDCCACDSTALQIYEWTGADSMADKPTNGAAKTKPIFRIEAI
ncbi:FeoC-like transcriptional regulator [Stenoxybacter acetivorans]|uniref:FeoC-like transcriptional regulator n=1 Tax=Stenoxybacter acetivorans TaxID=422441 RepID=UPI000A0230FC|nr:FeoC-like transcriptional regulator [Stenoxybacter acetivorans]